MTDFPNRPPLRDSSPDQADVVEAMGLGEHVLSDLHVGAGGGVQQAQALFASFPNKTFAVGNAETNDGHHTML
eukprot:4611632-Prymnesium_polylepis.1